MHQGGFFKKEAGSKQPIEVDESRNDKSFISSNDSNFSSIQDVNLEALDAINVTDRRWAWIEISRSAIQHNIMLARRMLGRNIKLLCVVKADAYGHGAVEVAKIALNTGADYLAVATIDEGIELRRALIGGPILLLSQPPKESIPLLLAYNIEPSIYDMSFALIYAEIADQQKRLAPYHLAINTGMNRIGVGLKDLPNFLKNISFHRALDIRGTYTHFATADEGNSSSFETQLFAFNKALDYMNENNYPTGIIHAANSACIIQHEKANFQMVRLGIAMYGLSPSLHLRDKFDYKPVMSVHAKIVDVRNVPVGQGVSYGHRYISAGNVTICTIPIGYADGLSRALSEKIFVLYNGVLCKQVGTICMDSCMFEVNLRLASTKNLHPKVGDEVMLVGVSKGKELSLDIMADEIGTINYELACNFGLRLPKVYSI